MELLDLTELLLDTRSYDLAYGGSLEALWCGAWRRVGSRVELSGMYRFCSQNEDVTYVDSIYF